MLVHHLHHLARLEILEARPAQIVVGAAFFVAAGGEDTPLHRFVQAAALQFFKGVQLVEPLDKQQVGDLLDDGERVRYTAGPEVIPNSINLISNIAGEHATSCNKASMSLDVRQYSVQGEPARPVNGVRKG
jgi:hypothetical protein